MLVTYDWDTEGHGVEGNRRNKHDDKNNPNDCGQLGLSCWTWRQQTTEHGCQYRQPPDIPHWNLGRAEGLLSVLGSGIVMMGRGLMEMIGMFATYGRQGNDRGCCLLQSFHCTHRDCNRIK